MTDAQSKGLGSGLYAKVELHYQELISRIDKIDRRDERQLEYERRMEGQISQALTLLQHIDKRIDKLETDTDRRIRDTHEAVARVQTEAAEGRVRLEAKAETRFNNLSKRVGRLETKTAVNAVKIAGISVAAGGAGGLVSLLGQLLGGGG